MLPPIGQYSLGMALEWQYITILIRNALLSTFVATILVPPIEDRVASLEDLSQNHPMPILAARAGSVSAIITKVGNWP